MVNTFALGLMICFDKGPALEISAIQCFYHGCLTLGQVFLFYSSPIDTAPFAYTFIVFPHVACRYRLFLALLSPQTCVFVCMLFSVFLYYFGDLILILVYELFSEYKVFGK